MPPRSVTRRELLKSESAAAPRGFAVPAWRERLLDAASPGAIARRRWLFRGNHLAASHRRCGRRAFEQFPYNGYDVLEPEIDFDAGRSTVGGSVARPGPYTLDQIRALPKQTHNTRHVCVEGWDVVGTLRRRPAARFSHAGRRGSGGALPHDDLRGRLLRVARHRDRAPSAVAALLRDVRPSARSRARRAAATEPARPNLATNRPSTS